MNTCFIIMPFAVEHDPVYKAYKDACSEAGYDCSRADNSYTSRLIMSDVVQQILDADIIVADLTNLNPNVLYELGVAHACSKKVLLTSEVLTTTSRLPFDVSGYRVHYYENTECGHTILKERVVKAIKNISLDGFSSPYDDALSRLAFPCGAGQLVRHTWHIAFKILSAQLFGVIENYERVEETILREASAIESRDALLKFARVTYNELEYPKLQRSKKKEKMPDDMTITVIGSNHKFIFHPSKINESVEPSHPFHALTKDCNKVMYWINRYSSEQIDKLNLQIPRRYIRLTRLAARYVPKASATIIVESHINVIHTLPYRSILQKWLAYINQCITDAWNCLLEKL